MPARGADPVAAEGARQGREGVRGLVAHPRDAVLDEREDLRGGPPAGVGEV